MAIQIRIYIDLLTQTRGGKKSKRKQTKEEKNIYKRTGGLYVPCSLDGLVESRAEAEPVSSLRMDTTSSTSTYGKINEWIKTMQMTQRYIVWKNRHEKNGDAHLTGLRDRYVRLQCLRYSWVLLHARRLYNQSIIMKTMKMTRGYIRIWRWKKNWGVNVRTMSLGRVMCTWRACET